MRPLDLLFELIYAAGQRRRGVVSEATRQARLEAAARFSPARRVQLVDEMHRRGLL